MIKSVLLFFLLLVVVRIMGKRQIGEMQPFELVITLIVAEVACIPMTDPSIPFSSGIIPIFVLTAVHFAMSLIARKSVAVRELVSGKPVIVINPNGVDYENLKKLNMTMHDLLEAVHSEGFFNLDEVQYAVFETNGKLCVVPKPDFAPATAKDVNVKNSPSSIAEPLIIDGKYLKKHLEKMKTTKAIINKQLAHAKIDLSDVSLLTLNEGGDIYIQPKNGKFVLRQL